VAIPDIFKAYDDSYRVNSFGHFEWVYGEHTKDGEDASKCVACGACESACPQKISIIEHLSMIRDAYNK